MKQQWSKPSSLALKPTSEEQTKESKSEVKEPLMRTNSLSHFVPGRKENVCNVASYLITSSEEILLKCAGGVGVRS